MATIGPVQAGFARRQLGAAAAWLNGPAGRPVLIASLVILAGQLFVALYEVVALGLPLVREAPPRFEPHNLAQTAFALLASALLVRALVRARAQPCLLEREALTAWARAAGLAVLAAAVAATAFFLADPAGFHAAAQEDRPLEWASALLVLGAAGLLGAHALRRRRDLLVLVPAAAFALVLFAVGMEEISWGQRLFGFATPERLAEMNWQAEFNFHNVQTDLSETAYYFGAGIFLLVLPLLRDLLPAGLAHSRWLELAPRRSVALVAAPVAIFNYGHWDLLPVQLTIMLAFWVQLAWSCAAARRGDRTEQVFFLAAAAAVLVGQTLFLAYGASMTDIPDATEYKEFFIALALAWYAVTVFRAAPPLRSHPGESMS